MKTSENLKDFRFERGEHTVIMIPCHSVLWGDGDYFTYTDAAVQVAADLAWNNPGKVLFLELGDDEPQTRTWRDMASAVDLTLPGRTEPEDDIRMSTISRRLCGKVTLSSYDPDEETRKGGLDAYLVHLIESAGDIETVVVRSVERIAKSNGPVEVTNSRQDSWTHIETRSRKEHPRWQYRHGELLSCLGKMAKEKNICVVSFTEPSCDEETFNRVSSLASRALYHWNVIPEIYVDTIHGVRTNKGSNPPRYGRADLWRTMITYHVNTKQIVKSEVLLRLTSGLFFSCHSYKNELDKLTSQ